MCSPGFWALLVFCCKLDLVLKIVVVFLGLRVCCLVGKITFKFLCWQCCPLIVVIEQSQFKFVNSSVMVNDHFVLLDISRPVNNALLWIALFTYTSRFNFCRHYIHNCNNDENLSINLILIETHDNTLFLCTPVISYTHSLEVTILQVTFKVQSYSFRDSHCIANNISVINILRIHSCMFIVKKFIECVVC